VSQTWKKEGNVLQEHILQGKKRETELHIAIQGILQNL
jgi:hypothetical protein